MIYGQIIAGTAIQLGSLLINAGMKRIVPELAKLFDDAELEEAIRDVKIDKLISKTCLELAKAKKS